MKHRKNIIFQASSHLSDSLASSERYRHGSSKFSPNLFRRIKPPELPIQQKKTESYKKESDVTFPTNLTNDNDLYSADIDYMNNYLKSLPDYTKVNHPHSTNHLVRLRENPTAKPFYMTDNDFNAKNSQKSSVQQSPKNQRKQINPLSKSNSIHTLSKRNIGHSIEKEPILPDVQKNKITRSTSSSTIPSKEPSDLMGFMKKHSMMNIFKKLGSQNSPIIQPKTSQSANNVKRNVHDHIKPPSMGRTKNIGDFWNENIQQQNTKNKFGWNYQKVMPGMDSKQLVSEAPKQALPSNLMLVKKSDSTELIKPTVSNLNKLNSDETCAAQFIEQQQIPHQNMHHIHSQHYPKSQSQSVSHYVKKLTESPKLQRSTRTINVSDHEQKLLKSSSNSHIYMNQDDPNYLKNLHKITKSLDNATSNIISNNKSSYKRSISNTSVPSYLGSSPQQSHIYCPPQNQPSSIMMMHPSSVPISFYPPISYKPPQDYNLHQRSGSKSNITLYHNKYPLNRSSSNTSLMTNFNGSAIGFYSVHDPSLWHATPALHHVIKSSSSSCIFAKTLSQPTHLSKTNDIFAKYKPIVSDEEESESEDDDTSKHSNPMKSSIDSINRLPAPAPFKKQQKQQTYKNYPPFTTLNSIQIPINGQLPSAFKNNSNNITEPMLKLSQAEERGKAIDQTIANGCQVFKKNCDQISSSTLKTNRNSSKPLPTSSSSLSSSTQAIKNSCNLNNNIFYNFMNPMAATQTQSINQMHLQQPCDGVGSSYTPYTKYLSDRKYFDVALSDGMNVCSGAKPEQRRTSTITEQQKVRPVEPSKVVTDKLCDSRDEENHASDEIGSATVVEPTSTTISNEPIFVDPKEILSAFDPYFIEDSVPQPSMSNKFHQLLTTVANEWGNSCDHAATPSAMISNCKAYQGVRYGSSQYEVLENFRSLFINQKRFLKRFLKIVFLFILLFFFY